MADPNTVISISKAAERLQITSSTFKRWRDTLEAAGYTFQRVGATRQIRELDIKVLQDFKKKSSQPKVTLEAAAAWVVSKIQKVKPDLGQEDHSPQNASTGSSESSEADWQQRVAQDVLEREPTTNKESDLQGALQLSGPAVKMLDEQIMNLEYAYYWKGLVALKDLIELWKSLQGGYVLEDKKIEGSHMTTSVHPEVR